jgi:hypothetical protein
VAAGKHFKVVNDKLKLPTTHQVTQMEVTGGVEVRLRGLEAWEGRK